MIVIVSQEYDCSTNDVMDWLIAWRKDIVRINETDTINSIYSKINDNEYSLYIRCGEKEFCLSKVDFFWFRRSGFVFDVSFLSNVNASFASHIEEHLLDECKTMKEFIVYLLENKPFLGNYHQGNANKLISLFIAKQVGLKIPNTIISSSKNDLSKFYEEHKSCITKSIQDVLCFFINEYRFFTTTSIVESKDIENMNKSFFPSLLQNNLCKRYELRIFYLKGKCYSMAIFSQENQQTALDFRNYSTDKPNRYVPYLLPKHIEEQLDLFMKKMNLDTGSIDMIVTPDFDYVFLEVNPVGQYDMVSVPCNYYLHKKIAQTLCHE